MPGPEQLLRVAIGLPVAIVRRVAGIAAGLIPGGDEPDEPAATDLDVAIAADDAMTREREPVEEGALAPDDPLTGHIDDEVELVAESADPDADASPGADVHVDDRR